MTAYKKLQDNELKAVGQRKPFKRTEGQALDSALASFNVCRQAYYGGTFVGNHVHRTLKVYKQNNLIKVMLLSVE